MLISVTTLRSWSKTEVELLNQITIQLSLAIQSVTLNQQAEQERSDRQKIEKIINEISTILVGKFGKIFYRN